MKDITLEKLKNLSVKDI